VGFGRNCKLYCSIIKPTVTYGCETWGLEGTVKLKLYCSIIIPTVTYGCEMWGLEGTVNCTAVS
jgi:hypothetical protein